MSILKRAAVAATVLLLTAGAAAAQTTIKWLHLDANPIQVKIWEEVARDFEAKNPGVKVELQFIEAEAYKAKLPSMLQSKDRPHVIYSWAGGVLKSQIEAGVIEDISAAMAGYKDTLAPATVDAFTLDGRIYGIPFAQTQTGFFYNKELMAKAGLDGARIKTWDDLLDAVKKLKAAGITPLMVGGADKWPLHFYWTNLAMRIGGKPAFEAALRGENGGFEAETFIKAGQTFKQLVDLEPFQNGFLGFKNQQALGAFGDGKAAMTLALSSAYAQHRSLSADKKGVSDENLGWFDFPIVAGGKGDSERHTGRRQRLAGHQGRAQGDGRVREVDRLAGRRKASGSRRPYHSRLQRRRRSACQSVDPERRAESGEVEVSPEFLRSESRSLGRTRGQRRHRRNRRWQHDARRGRQGDPGGLQAGQLMGRQGNILKPSPHAGMTLPAWRQEHR